ncbi:hypothetical protein BS47DRAFT_1391325 [Hydnum rufescens UP504]|uniref:Uncharacterized protein n=1 Tax=Hydnum rufescens UP504 TaxID=1448309 RepID=A0A9P6B1A0_9AGAM|nr:hypothetical protein BS47DRAFT_1391325 [Hydnum rufescens UP504]
MATTEWTSLGRSWGTLSTQNSMTLTDGHDEDDDYRREPSPLDPGQENADEGPHIGCRKWDDSAQQRIELTLRGAHGKKRGKSRNGKPAQSDFETALMRLWRSSTKEERQRENDARRLEQHEREASQSRQSAPTVSSAPPPPPPPPMPAPHHPPATSGSAQHAPTASTTGPASLPPRPPAPAPGLPDPRPVPMSREPPRAPRGMLIPREATGSPQGSKNGNVILLHHCGTIGANEIGTEPPNRPDHQGGCLSPFDVQLEGNPLCLHGDIFGRGHHHVNDTLGPHNDAPGRGLRQDDGTPDLHEDNPCHQELMGRDHCKVEGILLTLCLPHPTRGWSLV